MFHGTVTSQALLEPGTRVGRRTISELEPSVDCLSRREDDRGRANGRPHWALVRQPASVERGLTKPVPKGRQVDEIPAVLAIRLTPQPPLPISVHMVMFFPLVGVRTRSGALLTRSLPRAEAITC